MKTNAWTVFIIVVIQYCFIDWHVRMNMFNCEMKECRCEYFVIISLRHSVNGDFCGHSRFVLWHENLTTFVSWTLDSCQIWILGGGGVCLNPFQDLALIFSWRVGLNLLGGGGGVHLNPFQDLALIFSWRVGLNLSGGGGFALIHSKSWP